MKKILLVVAVMIVFAVTPAYAQGYVPSQIVPVGWHYYEPRDTWIYCWHEYTWNVELAQYGWISSCGREGNLPSYLYG